MPSIRTDARKQHPQHITNSSLRSPWVLRALMISFTIKKSFCFAIDMPSRVPSLERGMQSKLKTAMN